MLATQFHGLPKDWALIILAALRLYQVGQYHRIWLCGEVTSNRFRLSLQPQPTVELPGS